MYVITKYSWLQKLNDIPFLGGTVLIVFSATPGAILAVISIYLHPIDEQVFTRIAYFSFVLWNLILQKFDIKIYIFFLPAWAFWLVFSILDFVFDVI
jgi:hypothetical protein